MLVNVIIPAYNEEKSIARVIKDIPSGLVEEVIVINNNSADQTAEEAEKAGAKVLHEPSAGYGNACLKGVDYLMKKELKPDMVVFLDGDYSDYPQEMDQLIRPIVENNMDFVIGSRALGKREKKSMTPQQLFGNWLATRLIHLLFGYRYTDLGPFRAIRFDRLIDLKMNDRNYGWTVEMQIKAIKNKLRITEVPVNYRQRIGVSKVSGTIKGSILAGIKILYTIFKTV